MRLAELIKSVNLVMKANGDLINLLTGGIHSSRPKQLIARPYAILTAKHIHSELMSSNDSINKYVVNVKVYADAAMKTIDDINSALASLIDFNRTDFIAITSDTKTLLIRPYDEAVAEPDENPLGNEDILIFNESWLFLTSEQENSKYTKE